jgi:dienelactone hydrolase
MRANLRITFLLFIGLAAPIIACRAEVIKSEINTNGFVADFYCDPNITNTFGILFLGGSTGGKPYPLSFLPESGYPTLALAYFKEKGLPENLVSIPLEYFDKPIEWMQHNKNIPSTNIIVIGISRGAELSLLLGSIKPAIKEVIAISPSSVVWSGIPKDVSTGACPSWTLDGKPIPYMPVYPDDFASGVYNYFVRSLARQTEVERAAIHVENIRGPILLASGQDDTLWPSAEMGNAICARLKEKGFKCEYTHLIYKNAGHTFNTNYMIGGTFEGNKEARIDLIKQIRAFLGGIQN